MHQESTFAVFQFNLEDEMASRRSVTETKAAGVVGSAPEAASPPGDQHRDPGGQPHDQDHQDRQARHLARMQRKKAIIDAAISAAAEERGLLLVHTGNGKGKSSSAFGMLARALGHGLQCAVIQFVKSRSDTGEESFFRACKGVRWHVMGAGFTWDTQDDERDRANARAAWDQACAYLSDARIDLVVLDEFTYAINYGWVPLAEALAALAQRPRMQHVVVTGRSAPAGLIAQADTVCEMTSPKHAYQAGVRAMPGIEW